MVMKDADIKISFPTVHNVDCVLLKTNSKYKRLEERAWQNNKKQTALNGYSIKVIAKRSWLSQCREKLTFIIDNLYDQSAKSSMSLSVSNMEKKWVGGSVVGLWK